uniref:Uncharacterized protein n=1 Tax=Timema douglasi TaxID=61478 RepID=A0A7R8VV32_TIMDO|nr:unnamed protein product [Timema douglasi]
MFDVGDIGYPSRTKIAFRDVRPGCLRLYKRHKKGEKKFKKTEPRVANLVLSTTRDGSVCNRGWVVKVQHNRPDLWPQGGGSTGSPHPSEASGQVMTPHRHHLDACRLVMDRQISAAQDQHPQAARSTLQLLFVPRVCCVQGQPVLAVGAGMTDKTSLLGECSPTHSAPVRPLPRLSPVWVRRCLTSSPLDLNVAPQSRHSRALSPPRFAGPRPPVSRTLSGSRRCPSASGSVSAVSGGLLPTTAGGILASCALLRPRQYLTCFSRKRGLVNAVSQCWQGNATPGHNRIYTDNYCNCSICYKYKHLSHKTETYSIARMSTPVEPATDTTLPATNNAPGLNNMPR